MQIKWGEQIDEEDKEQARAILVMTQTDGWEILKAFWAVEEEKIIAKGTKAKGNETAFAIWKELNGFRQAREIVERILSRLEEKKNDEQFN